MGKAAKRPGTWREALEMVTRCPVCQASYKAVGAKLCAKDEHTSKVHLTCSTCGSFALVMIAVVGQGISSVGMATDLSFNDVARMQNAGPLNTDELINGYEFLHNDYSLARLSKTTEQLK